jgi:tripartite-type tricarboxylate transporter receptor subunit TctC
VVFVKIKSTFYIYALVIAACCELTTAFAQPFPNKPIRLLVGFPPGGAVDIMARTISQPLSEKIGQPVIVENLPGAGGNVAADYVAHSDSNGYILLMSAVSSLAISANVYRNPRYNLLSDLVPIAVVASVPNVLVINPKINASSVAGLISLSKSQPGKLTFASAGTGTTVHFSGELFKSMSGADITHVPYKGASQAMNDLLGNHVDMMFDFLSAAGPHIKSGSLRALGVTSKTRSTLFPEIPTIAESGLPDYEVLGYFGVFARSGTPSAIVEQLNLAIGNAVNTADVRRQLDKQSATPVKLSQADFAKILKSDVNKWSKIVELTGVHAD